ncbi:hypothetical protein BH10BDE1_BH10BDE1_29580 [soil metagenome]
MKYYFRYSKNDEGRLVARCLNLHACKAAGGTLQELKSNARAAVTDYLTVPPANYLYPATYRVDVASMCDRLGISVDVVFGITLAPGVAFAIELRRERTNAKLHQHEMAKLLGLRSLSAYQRFEDPLRANPTLKTVAKIKAILPGLDVSNAFERDP